MSPNPTGDSLSTGAVILSDWKFPESRECVPHSSSGVSLARGHSRAQSRLGSRKELHRENGDPTLEEGRKEETSPGCLRFRKMCD